jgi:hypothetical protein
LSEISTEIEEALKESLLSYYNSISEGNLSKLSSLMTKESYLLTIATLGFKKAFKDDSFKYLLEKIETDSNALSEVEGILSYELKKEPRENVIVVLSYEQKGSDRITVHYTQEGKLKKIYFSNQDENWKIDLKAGRKKDF